MATKDVDINGIVSAIGILVALAAEMMGKSTSDVLKEVEVNCAARAINKSDDSDTAAAEVAEDMPESSER